MTSYSQIRYDVDDPVALITLDRPEAMNAWTGTMDGELRDALERACGDPAVMAIVITGAGRAFCAGADMNLLQGLSSGEHSADDGPSVVDDRVWADPEQDLGGRLTYLMSLDKPVIAAVNGAVAGMAYPLALACDMRVVTPQALFVTAFAQRGLIAEWGLSWMLPRLVGPSVALDLLFSSRRVGGAEALQLGLANYLVEPDELLPFCRSYVEQLAASCSPASIAAMKRQVYQHLHRGLGAAEVADERLMRESFGRGDFAEGVQSFVEKRPPRFERIGGRGRS